MKKVLAVLASVAFVTVMTLSVSAQEPQKKECDKKAKTEKCDTKKSKDCPKACDKKAETKKCDETKKKEEKKK
jgi:preprotein translocase subunit SecG